MSAVFSVLESTDELLCHCLNITASEVRVAVDSGTAETLRDVMRCTGAGMGCTACHRKIREAIAKAKACQATGELVPA